MMLSRFTQAHSHMSIHLRKSRKSTGRVLVIAR